MNQPAILLTCPTCKETWRTGRETRPRAKIRCPGCRGLFSFFVHGNGAVELRPVDDEPAGESRSRLPPRVAGQGEPQATRRILASRRRNRPFGGYEPFGKARSYLGMLALWTLLGLGSLSVYWYFTKVDTISKATGRTAANPWQSQDEARRKAFQVRQKRALEELKKPATKVQVQPAAANLEDRRPSDDQALPD